MVILLVPIFLSVVGCDGNTQPNANGAQKFVEQEIEKWMAGESNRARNRTLSIGAIALLNRPISFQVLSVVLAKTQTTTDDGVDFLDSVKGTDKIFRINVELQFRDAKSNISRKSVEYLASWRPKSESWNFCLRSE